VGLTGYRLFVGTVHDGQKHDYRKFDDLKAIPNTAAPTGRVKLDYIDSLTADLTPRLKEVLRFGSSSDEDEVEGVARSSGGCLRFTEVNPSPLLVELKFDQGVVNSDGILVDPNGLNPDQDLKNFSTVFGYRALITYLPDSDRAIIAVETRGRSCPYQVLRRALRMSSSNPWRIQTHQNIADLAAVRQFLRTADMEEVRLRSSGYNRDGQHAMGASILNVDVDTQKLSDFLRQKITSWAEHQLGALELDSAAEITAVATEVAGAGTNLDFNDVKIQARGNHATKTLGPNSDYRKFVYDLGPDLVSDSDFFNEVRTSCAALINTIQAFAKPKK